MCVPRSSADVLVITSGYQNLKNYIAEDDGKKAGVVVTMQDKYVERLACWRGAGVPL